MKQLNRINAVAVVFFLLGSICVPILSQVINCYDANGQPTRCEPPRRSFSFGLQPRTNSTCGIPPSSFCFRTVNGSSISSNCNGVCNATNPSLAHPPNFMTDSNETWWQSENSRDPGTSVMIELSFRTLVEINVIAFTFMSPTPSAFYIEKSTDYGLTYQPFHYFGVSCNDTYMIDPNMILSLDNETAPLCQPISTPPESGQIEFFPTNGRPTANDSVPGFSENLYNFTTASDIRIILDDHFIIDNLDADDPGYYYAVENLNVTGSCQCHGHASACTKDPSTGQFQCLCQHNTSGTFCERCRDFFNDLPWQRADGNEPFECKACNCNGHSTQCVFDAATYEQTGRRSGGICINCTDNTAGRQCETCAEFFYAVPQNGSTMCTACGCNATGSINATCDQMTGICSCKPNIIGDKCDTCMPGFYHVDPTSPDGCKPCNCNMGGALSRECDVFSGQCYCRVGVTGRTCSQTTPGYFFPAIDYILLEAEDAGGIPSRIILTNGENINFTGTGYYRVIDRVSIVNFGTVMPPISGTYEVTFRYSLEGTMFWDTATLHVLVGSEEGIGLPSDCNELPVGTSQVHYRSWTLGVGLTISQRLCLRGGRSYTFTLQDFNSGQTRGTATLDIDSLVIVLTTSSSLQVFSNATLSAQYFTCTDAWRSLIMQSMADPICGQITFAVSTELYNGTLMCDCDSTGSVPNTTCQPFGGQCTCLPGVRGRRCDECSPGYHSFSTTGCTDCNCHENGSSSDICQAVGGFCSCWPNVQSQDCSSCAPNHWGLTAEVGCLQCSCNATGSESLQCDQITGACTCKAGVGGLSCDHCQDFHYRFLDNGCRACACDLAGAINDDCDLVSGQCTCRTNTRTRDCSQCADGTFNLQPSNPDGCQPCFCSGQSNTCIDAQGFGASSIVTEFNSSEPMPLQGWSVVSSGSAPNPIPESVTGATAFSDGGITIFANIDAYLQAPTEYLGNRLSSYSQFLNIMLAPVVYSIDFQTVVQPDVILSGRGIQIGVNFSVISGSGLQTIRVQLHESSGWRNTRTNQALSAYEIQLVLSSLDQMRITAGFNTDVVLYSISLDTTVPTANGTTALSVEQCTCPTNYTGLSCEQCAPGYTRSASGTCELCQCNDLSTTCDSETGACMNCSGFATGDSCEQCSNGTYGDPTRNIPCQPCPCPFTTEVGQFTDECILLPTGEPMCIDCPQGHRGLRCETCAEGFFGDPLGVYNLNGTPSMCSDCLCNGNIDPNIPGSCDNITGICLMCTNNTAGDRCERCADSFYGDAIVAKNCTACACNHYGSNGTTCHQVTGQCECLPNVVGLKCDRCAADTYDFGSDSGCIPCNCHPMGAVSQQCNASNGQCECQPGVTGRTCNQCQSGFFGFSSSGCQECNCSLVNSVSNICAADGGCVCRSGATGMNCQQCMENHFQTLQGCTECPECYQELQADVNATRSDLQTTDSRILSYVRNMTSFRPFSSRFSQRQNEIRMQMEDAKALEVMHNSLIDQYLNFSVFASQLFPTQILWINNSFEMLKNLSNITYMQASTAEELRNLTTRELSLAIQILNEILSMFLPLAQRLTTEIEGNTTAGNLTAIDLENHVANLSSQIEELMNLTNKIIFLSSSALNVTQQMETLHMDTIQKAAEIEQNITLVEMIILILKPKLTGLTLSIASTADRIHQQFGTWVFTLPESQLNDLIWNASISEAFAQMVENETITQQDRLSRLTGTLGYYQRQLDSLQQQISSLRANMSNITSRTESAYNISTGASNATNSTLTVAEIILRNLQSFNNNSFEVATLAMELLRNVHAINASAEFALTTATQIQENVTLAGQAISSAKQVASQAEHTIQQSEQDVTIDTANLVSDVSTSLNSTQKSLDNINSSLTAASNILLNLENQSVTVNRTVQLENADTIIAESEVFRNQTREAVDMLQQALVDISGVDMTKLAAVQNLTASVNEEITTQDIYNVFDILRNGLEEQQRTRQTLELKLLRLREQLAHLTHINSTLPQGCDNSL